AKASINTAVDKTFTSDFVINSGAGLTGGVDPGLARQLNNIPQVQAATGIRIGAAKINGSVQSLIGVDSATAFQLFDVKPLQGSTHALDANAIAIYKNVASDKHLHVGDTVTAVFADGGTKQLRVALIYGENRTAGNYVLGIDAFDANFANHYDA